MLAHGRNMGVLAIRRHQFGDADSLDPGETGIELKRSHVGGKRIAARLAAGGDQPLRPTQYLLVAGDTLLDPTGGFAQGEVELGS